MSNQQYEAYAQTGPIGHCTLAQVFGPDGQSVLCVDATPHPRDATRIAKICAKALNEARAKDRNEAGK